MAWQGFAMAFCAAASNSVIDFLRKLASQKVNSTQCVCVVAMLEGTLAFAFVFGQGTLSSRDAAIWDNRDFLWSAFMSAALRLLSLLLYQTAIQLAPLSVTIPYLSFTPAMLLLTAYLLIGEQPSWIGLAGVMVVTLGGYLLAFNSAGGADRKSKTEDSAMCHKPSSPPPPTEGAVSSLQQLGDSKASILMCVVAFLWSLTSTFDKMGMAAAPTIAAYLAVQRGMTAVPCVLYVITKDPTAFRILARHSALMLGLVASELTTVLLYLGSLRFLFVSYAVAAKRTGILLSVLVGCIFFGEQIRDKIHFILLMVLGMMMIVLAPDMKYNAHLVHRP